MQEDFRIKDPSKYRYVKVGGIRQRKKHTWVDISNMDKFNRVLESFREPAVSVQRFSQEENDQSEYIVDLCFDFDANDNLKKARADAVRALKKLKEEFGLSSSDYNLFFTGNRGFNIIIPAEILGKDVHYNDIKYVAPLLKKKWELESLDKNIYGKNKLIRYPNFINLKSNLYKVYLEEDEFLSLPMPKIKDIARSTRGISKRKFSFNPSFRGKFNQLVAKARKKARQKQEDHRKTVLKKEGLRIDKIEAEDIPQKIRDKFQLACKYCTFLSYLQDRPEDVSYMQWWLGIITLYQLEGGEKLLHHLSSLAPDEYNQGGKEELEYQIGYAYRKGLNPPACSKVKEYFGGCFSGCKVHSPVDFLTPLKESKRARALCDNPYFKPPRMQPLAGVREKLRKLLERIRDEDDKKVHIINVEPGVGKTRTAIEVFLNEKFTWFAPMHDVNLEQAINYKEELVQGKEASRTHKKFPKPSVCERFPLMEKFFQANLDYRVSLCSRICNRMNECPYLSGFKGAENVDQLFVPDYYLTIDDFMANYGNPQRKFVIIDEDCVTRLCYPKSASKDELERFKRLLEDFVGEYDLPPFQQNAADLIFALIESIISQATAVRGKREDLAFGYFDPDKISAGIREPIDMKGLQIAFTRHVAEQMVFEFTSFFGHIEYLLKQRQKIPLLLQYEKRSARFTFHFNYRHQLPAGKTTLILSATARPEVYRRITNREIVAHHLPWVEHTSDLYQIMDGSYPRISVEGRFDSLLERMERIRGKTSYRKDQTTLILPKQVEEKNKEKIKHLKHHHFRALRGSTKFETFELHFIVGTPKTNEPSYFMLGIALNGGKILKDITYEDKDTPSEKEDVWLIKLGRFSNYPLQLAYKVLVTDELLQAVGRSRYIRGRKTVYIVTNEPLPMSGITRVFFKDEIGKKRQKRVELKHNQIRRIAAEHDGEVRTSWVLASGVYRDRETAKGAVREVGGEEGWIEEGYRHICDDPRKLAKYRLISPSGYYSAEQLHRPSSSEEAKGSGETRIERI